jgi:mono/diheme cytochrome c family protein
MKKFLLGFLAAVLLFILGALAVVYSGVFNVAATWPDNAVVAWVLHETMEHSVQSRAGTSAPASFTDAQVTAGAKLYNDTCIYCHGGPGKDPADIGQGLNPEPPFLPDTAAGWTSAQLFWIVKNGVRMTGMPAFGKSHKDDELWSIVAFVQRLPKMKPEEYDQLVK